MARALGANGHGNSMTLSIIMPVLDEEATIADALGALASWRASGGEGIVAALERSEGGWGRFDVCIAGRHPLLPLIAVLMNVRSRLTGIATGDQAMFVRREAFAAVGGFPDIALMEDVVLSRRLKRLTRPLCLSARVTTSGRRWDQQGWLRTVVVMWRVRLAAFLR